MSNAHSCSIKKLILVCFIFSKFFFSETISSSANSMSLSIKTEFRKKLYCKKCIFLVFHRNKEMNEIFELKNLYKAQLL